MQSVGFDVEFALHVGVNVRDDTAIVRWARQHDRIFLCHDKHQDKRTRLELYPEIYYNGGKIIRIGGAPDQDPLVALGKILAHLDEWRDFFGANDGMVVVHKQGINYLPSDKLYARVQGAFDKDRATGRKVIKPSRERKPRGRRESSVQGRLNL